MKVNHELTLDTLYLGSTHNDYDFFLPHLADQYEDYAKYFRESKEKGRYIIMDNSLHEIGEAYDHDRLKYWLNELKPNVFIVPDVWENMNETLSQAKYWISWFKNAGEELKDVTPMAVVQAKAFEEAEICYINLKELGYKKIAFSYGAEYFNVLGKHPNVALSKALGRIQTILSLISNGVIEENDKIHLLGCSAPQEFGWYRGIKQIETIDTSNPVMAGLEGVRYYGYGLDFKPKVNLNSHFDKETNLKQHNNIIYNLNQFKILNGIR